mgnify:CR=1 FL=1
MSVSEPILLETSVRHVHLSKKDLKILFGSSEDALHSKRELSQPGQFACHEKVDVVGPKHSALIGPTRKSGSVLVTVRVPAGSALEAKTSLGVITADGPFAEVGAKTGAGDVTVQEAGVVDLCRRHQIHLQCYGTVAGGFLGDRWLGQPAPDQPADRSQAKYRLIIEEFGGLGGGHALSPGSMDI